MNDQSDVRFVDSHSEGDGRHYDLDLVFYKPLLNRSSIAQSSVICHRRESVLIQSLGKFFSAPPGNPIENGRPVAMFVEIIEQPIILVSLGVDSVSEIGPVEARKVHFGTAKR